MTDARALLAWEGAADAPRRRGRRARVRGALRSGRTIVLGAPRHRLRRPGLPGPHAVVAPVVTGEKVVGTLAAYGPHASRGAGAGHRGGGPLGVERSSSSPSSAAQRTRADGGRAAGPAGPDQPALHLQLADGDRLLRPHRPRAGARAAARVRRLHPLRLPPRRRVHDARRGAAQRRALPRPRAGPLRRPAHSHVSDRARGAAGRRALPLPSSRWWRTPCGTGSSRQGGRSGTSRSCARTPAREALITIEDDGVGSDPEQLRRVLGGDPTSDSVGLGNVDARLRQVFGDDYGLVVETAPGAGHQGDLPRAEVRARGPPHA